MKTRLVRPELFSDERLSGVGPYALPLLLGLPCLADRDGRLEDKPLQIKTLILPYASVSIDDFNSTLNQLHELEFLVRYEVGGKRYIEIADFINEQKPHPKEACKNLPVIPEGKQELKESSGNSMKLNEISGNYIATNSNSNSNSNSNNNINNTTKERSSTTKAKAAKLREIKLPPETEAPEVMQALTLWLEYKKEKKQPYQPTGLQMLYKKLSEMGGAKFVLAVENSIQSNYSGLFAPSEVGSSRKETPAEKSQRILRENHIKFTKMQEDEEAGRPVQSNLLFGGFL